MRQIHIIVKHKGIPEGFKIINRFETLLFDSDLIAGVDYDNGKYFDDTFYEQEENSEYTENNDLNQDINDEIGSNELLDIIHQHTVVENEKIKKTKYMNYTKKISL